MQRAARGTQLVGDARRAHLALAHCAFPKGDRPPAATTRRVAAPAAGLLDEVRAFRGPTPSARRTLTANARLEAPVVAAGVARRAFARWAAHASFHDVQMAEVVDAEVWRRLGGVVQWRPHRSTKRGGILDGGFASALPPLADGAAFANDDRRTVMREWGDCEQSVDDFRLKHVGAFDVRRDVNESQIPIGSRDRSPTQRDVHRRYGASLEQGRVLWLGKV